MDTNTVSPVNKPVATLGDEEILQLPAVGFFCSQRYPSAAVTPALNWAKKAMQDGVCVMSGFHSLLEKSVWDMLQLGNQPIVWVVARALPKRLPANLQKQIESRRLLVVSPFNQPRATAKSGEVRNRYIIENAASLVVAHAAPNGKLAALFAKTKKPVTRLT